MKKYFIILVTIIYALSLGMPDIALSMNNIKVIMNGQEIQLSTAPVVEDKIIPLSFVAEALSAKIEVNRESNQITINNTSYGLMLAAKSHILVEPESGLILLSNNSRERLQVGSVNKVMNLLLTFEALETRKISLEDIVTASKQASGTGGSQIFLETGEQQSVETLIESIVIIGANDSAVALAEYMAGSEEAFVFLMNQKAKDLGLKDTYFINVTGLDAERQYSSAYDIAIMTRELISKYPKILQFASIKDMIFQKPGPKKIPFHLVNSNKLLENYQGSTGLKTGSTANAGYCIVGTAERTGFQLIAVVLGASGSEVRYNEAAALFDFGFESYSILD